MHSEQDKYKERIEQLSSVVKSKQNDSVNMNRINEDLKHQINSLKSELRISNQELEAEKKSKQQALAKKEEENKKKF